MSFDQVKQKMNEFAVAIEQSESILGVIAVAKEAKNFAIVTKGEESYFVVMNEGQALAVNGSSVLLGSLPGVGEAIKTVVEKALQASLDSHTAKLNPLKAIIEKQQAPAGPRLPGSSPLPASSP